MGRSRVLSFISQLSGQGQRDTKLITPSTDPPKQEYQSSSEPFAAAPPLRSATAPTRQSQSTPTTPVRAFAFHNDTSNRSSPFVNNNSNNGPRRTRSNSRPISMVQTYHPPLMDVNEDTIPELQPIFTFLNSHANKLYQEGYFLKLDDQDNQGRPNPNRTWTEYFAQLVGNVLSLWDATELDLAGEDGEVLPKFINLTDASIQMIESLPTRSNSPNEPPLQNVLSISTAGRNRYLLHFNSHHSLIQWTAGIRLAMYEQATLQEAYTGALIAGRGKTLNNINLVMERMRQKYELWVRVRFGAGTPWRRCWCVVSPPDEKEYQKKQKEMKKRSPYDRSHAPVLKGDIRFYNTKIPTKKLKKATPLAAITDAYSAYAIYPQAKSLIDASTLVKVEGTIKYYLDPPSSKEGFVFIMPEVPPAVSGFEMLLRFLFPTWDTFALYGRPGRLVASVLDQRSLMFAMPKHKRYGYLEILDITGLILEKGSNEWSEREWRRRLRALTGDRMAAMDDRASYKTHSRSGSRRMSGSGSVSGRPRVNFVDDVGSTRTGRSHIGPAQPAARTDSAPPTNRFQGPSHSRNSSDPQHIPPQMTQNALGHAGEFVPSESPARGPTPVRGFRNDLAATPEGHSSDEDHPPPATVRELHGARNLDTPEPAPAPPAFAHAPSSKPAAKPYHSPELRRANSRLSHATLAQMAKLRGIPTGSDTSLDKAGNGEESPGLSSRFPDQRDPAVHTFAGNPIGMMANTNGSREALTGHSNASIPRSSSPLGYNTTALRIATSDSRGYQSPPDSRSNSLESAKTNNFSRPFTPPVMTSNQSAPRLPLPSIQTNQPVPRKPLPQIPTTIQGKRGNDESTPPSETSTGNFHRSLDVAALDKVHPPQRGTSPLPEPKPIFRQDTQWSAASSQYDDTSTESPSYASTVHSEEPTLPADRPRAGILRTVGDVNHDASTSGNQFNDNIPEINFGPTFNLAGPLSPRNKTPTSNAPAQRPYSPAQKTPPLDKGHYRQGSEDTIRRNVAWQPGASSAGASNLSSRPMSPEQYVQQRAQNAATPLYSHQRQPSGNTLASLRMTTPTPPLNKFVSHEPATQPSHSRSSSSDLLHRQNSQSTQLALGMAAKSEVSAHLSAREQEQVARMTGTSLIQGAGHHQAAPRAGLVGAIAQREKEKEQMKQGFGNHAVQHAINQRQQVHTQQMYQQQMPQQTQMYQQQIPQQTQMYQQQIPQQTQMYQQQMPQQTQMYGISDRPLPSAYTAIPQQGQPRQQYGAPPTHYTAQVFTQGGGYGNPNMRQQDQLGPRLMSPSQGQYSLGTPQGQGGRGYSSGPQFQGQTY